jgi:hypothetical protein
VNDATRMRPERHRETADAAALRARLRHVYWLGGGTGAGKSTIARRIAARHGLHLYATDDVMSDHATRSTPEDSPFLTEFKAMDMDERWVNRSPETMLETFHWFRGESFSLIVEDLLRLSTEPCVIVEGFRLLPHLAKPLLAVPSHAVWLVPTPDFRRPRSTAGLEVEHRREDQRSGEGPAQPARTRSDVHRTYPRGSKTSRTPHHRGRQHDDRG